MKISVNEFGTIELKEVFHAIILTTDKKEKLFVCMRDSGFEIMYQGKSYSLKENEVLPLDIDKELLGLSQAINFDFGQAINFDFGQAINFLKEGKRVSRKGWNGNGMYAYYVPANSYPASTEIAKKEFNGELVPYRPYLALKTVQNDIATWNPSTSDCLATDWFVVQ